MYIIIYTLTLLCKVMSGSLMFENKVSLTSVILETKDIAGLHAL